MTASVYGLCLEGVHKNSPVTCVLIYCLNLMSAIKTSNIIVKLFPLNDTY